MDNSPTHKWAGTTIGRPQAQSALIWLPHAVLDQKPGPAFFESAESRYSAKSNGVPVRIKRDEKMNQSKARSPTEQSALALNVIGLMCFPVANSEPIGDTESELARKTHAGKVS